MAMPFFTTVHEKAISATAAMRAKMNQNVVTGEPPIGRSADDDQLVLVRRVPLV
jgi:hypothetical protein